MGCTTVAFEGALDHPGPETVWRLVEELGVTGVFTSPTAVRLLMRYGEAPARGFDLRSLERVVCAGEVLNAPAWEWLQQRVFDDRVPVIDHMWQTETGGPVFGNPYGLAMLPIKPGLGGAPAPRDRRGGREPADGRAVRAGREGDHGPAPAVPRADARALGRAGALRGRLLAADPGRLLHRRLRPRGRGRLRLVRRARRRDHQVAGHKLGTIEVETALLTHPAVAEAGVTGRPDALRGEVISRSWRSGRATAPSEALRRELLQAVRRELGPVAVMGDLNFVQMLPKTRSGKIMRRVFKAVTLGRDPGDITTIEDEGSVEEARRAWREMRDELASQPPGAAAERPAPR